MTPPAPNRRSFALLSLGMAAFVVYGSLVPFEFRPRPPGEAADSFAWAMANRAVPQSRSDGLANVLIAVPLGFALLGWACVDRPGLGRAVRWGAAVVPAAVLLAAAVEFGQLFLPARTCAGSDVIAQGIGAAVGVVMWAAVGQWLTGHARAIWAKADGAEARMLAGYLALLAFVQTLPLDLTPSPADLYRKLRDTVRYVPFREFRDAEGWGRVGTLCQVLALYLPVGLLARRIFGVGSGLGCSPLPQCFIGGEVGGAATPGEGAFGFNGVGGVTLCGKSSPPHPPRSAATSPPPPRRGRGEAPSRLRLMLLALGVALAMESLQLVVHSRVPSATDVVVGACGAVCGWFARRSPPFVAAYLALLVVHAWQPWVARDAVAFDWVPGLPLEAGNPLFSLEEFLTRAVLFAPLGLIARRPKLAAAVGAAVAAALEVGQMFVASRYPCVTDVVIGGFGAWAGATARLATLRRSVPEVR